MKPYYINEDRPKLKEDNTRDCISELTKNFNPEKNPYDQFLLFEITGRRPGSEISNDTRNNFENGSDSGCDLDVFEEWA